MKSIETSIIINAPATEVWETLIDFSKYPQWNPFIQKIAGNPVSGALLEVDIQPPGQQKMTFRPTVLVSEANQEFRWRGKTFIKGLFDGEHYFQLTPVDAQRTRLDQGEYFSGLLSGVIFAKIGLSTKHGFEAMNTALKKRVEGKTK